jgi:RNA polymerase sigma-70 factor (ECF subfamily)
LNQANQHIDADNTLLNRCRKGEEKAFKELYLQYSKAMFNVCVRLLNNQAAAEDALQESFIAAFKSLHRFEGKSSFGSWLKRIVINRCITELRKQKPVLVPVDEETEASPEEDEYDEPEQVYSVVGILAAMQQLPPGYRLILGLYLFEEYSHREIAEQLGISEGTSKSQYARARKKLQQLIKNKSQKA